jgi:hypothetical protein
MINLKGKNNKKMQYAMGGVVGIIILVLWFSIPLMDKSAWNTAVPEGNPFSSKSVDLRGLSDGVGYENGAPGSPLSGEMTYNPATAGEDINSSLYSSGFEGMEDGEGADGASSGDVAVSKGSGSKGGSASGAAPRHSMGKLNKVASIGSGGGGTGTSGKKHGKFFGGGNDRAKFANNYAAPIGKLKKNSKLLASASNAQNQGKKASAVDLKGKSEAGRSGIASAFGNLVEADTNELTTSLENSANESGIVAGSVSGEGLKKSTPGLNKSDVTPPDPGEPTEDIDNDEQYKQMIMKMLIQATLGSVFGAIGGLMANAINPPAGSEDQQIGTQRLGGANPKNP